MRIQLRNVILEVANVVDVQLRTHEGAPLKPRRPSQHCCCLRGERCGRLGPAMFNITLDKCPLIKKHRLAILQLLIVAKRCCVLTMKWLIAQAIQAVPKVHIAIEQRVEDNLTKGLAPNQLIPERIWTAVDAEVESGEHGLVLVDNHLFIGIEHSDLLHCNLNELTPPILLDSDLLRGALRFVALSGSR